MTGSFDLPCSVINQDIDSSHFVQESIEHGIHLLLLGEIGPEKDGGVLGASTLDFIPRCLCPFLTPKIIDSHPATLCSEADGDCLTYSRTGPSYQNALVFNAVHLDAVYPGGRVLATQ